MYHFAGFWIKSMLVLLLLSVSQETFPQSVAEGGVFLNTDRIIWLDAGQISLPNNSPVNIWNDLSGKGNHALQGNIANQPEFISNSHIGPAVRFQESKFLEVNNHPSLDGMDDITFIVVARPTAVDKAHAFFGKRQSWNNNTAYTFFLWESKLSMDIALSTRVNSSNNSVAANTNYIFSGSSAFGSNRQVHINSLFQSTQTNSPKIPVVNYPMLIGRLDLSNSNYFQGDIAEMMMLGRHLNQAELRVVENMLAKKHGLGNELGQRYLLGNFSDDYTNNIIGIGIVNSSNKHTGNIGGGGALYLKENGNSFTQANEFVFAAHNDLSGTSTQNYSNPNIVHRWSRIWKVEHTVNGSPAAGGASVSMTFDFQEMELPASSSNVYALMFRNDEFEEFSPVQGIMSSATGNKVTFVIPAGTFTSGYYTIGMMDQFFKTWYSFKDGNWDDPTVWSINSSFWENPGLLTPSTSLTALWDNVIIRPGQTITVESDGLKNNSIHVSGFLDLGSSSSHYFTTISGTGRIDASGDHFPEGNASQFLGPGGGTLRFYGSSFELQTSRVVNHMVVDMYTGQELVLLSNYTVRGNLRIVRGTLMINNDISTTALQLIAEGNCHIQQDGSVRVGRGNARHFFTFLGDLIIEGHLHFSNLDTPNYTSIPLDGIVDARFLHPSSHQEVDISGPAEFYRIIINKGSDKTYYVWLKATDPGYFKLMGRNNFSNSDSPIPPSNLANTLAIFNGTARIGTNIHIPVLQTGGSNNHNIYPNACLWIDGGNVTNPSQAIVVYGMLKVSAGFLTASGNEGITVRETGSVEITGGNVEANIIRTSIISGIHRGSYFQKGGKVLVRKMSGDGYASHYRFSFPYPDNSFRMQGGELEIRDPKSTNGSGQNGGFLVGALPSNINVTGGTVIMDHKDRNFHITSTAPFYDLILRKSTSHDREFRLTHYPENANPPISGIAQQDLVVLNKLTIESVRLSSNDANIILHRDIDIFSNSILEASNSDIIFRGDENSSFILRNPSIIQNLQGLVVSKNNPEASLLLVSPDRSINPQDISNTILNISGDLKITKGILDYSHFRIIANSGVHLNGIIGSEISTGRLRIDGSSSADLLIPSNGSGSIWHLEVNNAAGVFLKGNTLGHVRDLTLSSGIFHSGVHGLAVSGNINGAPFGAEKMIAMAGNHSDAGLSRTITGNGQLIFPVGVIIEGQNKFTPLVAGFSNHTEDVILQLNLATKELPTLANNEPDLAMKIYWRVRHNQVSALPDVDYYSFSYCPSFLPDMFQPDEDFVPGKIVNFERFHESHTNIDYENHIITFNKEGQGFQLEQGEYTAAHFLKFLGQIRIFYSIASETIQYEGSANWNSPDTWSLISHSGIPSTEVPGAGDLVVIGYSSPSKAHSVRILDNAKIAGLIFNAPPPGNNYNLPRVHFGDTNPGIELNSVEGEGMLFFRVGSGSEAVVSADLGEFSKSQRSEFVYETPSGSWQPFIVPGIIPHYPNLSFRGNTIFTLPGLDITIEGNLKVMQNATVKLSHHESGNILIKGNLELGSPTTGKLQFQNDGYPRIFSVEGNIILNHISDVFGVNPPGGFDITHRIKLGGNFLRKKGLVKLQDGLIKAELELTGDLNGQLVSLPDSITLYRVIMNKDAGSSFTLSSPVHITAEANTIQKPVEIISGTLILDHDEIDLLLSSGGGDFVINEDGCLAISRGQARITGPGGVQLQGKLHLLNQGKMLIHDGNNNNYIEYGSGGKSTLMIEDNAHLEVGSHIRGATTFNDASLRYIQTGGSVTVGSSSSFNQNHPVFEISNNHDNHSQGSLFHFTGGSLNIIRGPAANQTAVFLDPNTFVTSGDAVLNLGTNQTAANTVIRIKSKIPLPNVHIAGNNNYTVITESTPLVVTEELLIESGKTLNTINLDLKIKGNLTSHGTIQIPDTRSLMFTGGNQLITGNINVPNITIESQGQVSLNEELPAVITTSGDLRLISGSLNDNGSDIFIFGNLEIFSQHISPTSDGGLFFQGENSVSIIGGGITGNITLDNSKGIKLADKLQISGRLRLNEGILLAGSFPLVFTETATVEGDFDSSSHIMTEGDLSDEGITKRFAAGEVTDFLFPIGSWGKYTPAEFKGIISTTAGSITVIPVNEIQPVLKYTHPDDALRYYWSISGHNLSLASGFVLQLQYDPEDLPGGDLSDFFPGILKETGEEFVWELYLDEEDEVIDLENHLIILGLEGVGLFWDYTAGINLPEDVLKFSSKHPVGYWEDETSWECNLCNPELPFPAGGPRGSVVVIDKEHKITITQNHRRNYRTIIEGTLKTGTTLGHSLGYIQGSGTIKLENGHLPVGNKSKFFEQGGGTVELSGNSNYFIPEEQYFNNLVLSGAGERSPAISNIHIRGHLSITEQAVLNTSTGDLSIAGNLLIGPEAGLISGTAEMIFNGSTQQRIQGDFTGQNAFNRLRINNNSGLLLQGNIEIKDHLHLQSGIIYSSPAYMLNLAQGANVTVAVNHQSFIDGPVRKNQFNSSSFLFPVGKQGFYAPVSLEEMNSFFSSTVVAEYFRQAHENTFVSSPLKNVSTQEYWNIQHTGSGSARVRLHWLDTDFSGITSPTELVVARFNDQSQLWESSGSAGSGPGWVSSLPINSFGDLTFGSSSVFENPLPVELLSFTAEVKDGAVMLKWTTASETNNSHFTIQRSLNAFDYHTLDYIAGAGTVNHIQHYEYFDNEPFRGVSYYRLIQNDFDGKTSTYGPIAVFLNQKQNISMLIFPNPWKSGNLNISLSGMSPFEDINWIMTDIFGKQISSGKTNACSSGNVLYHLTPPSGLKNGIYVISIFNSHLRVSQKIVII
jgi:hypothetical protein